MEITTRLLLLTLACCGGLAPAQAPPSPDTAQILGIEPEIDRLASTQDRWERLALHQQIAEQVEAASLQVDATMAQIDNEQAQANELRGYLSDRRDRAVNRANLFSIIAGGGLGATSAGLQIPSGLTNASAGVGIAGGALSTALAIHGIRAQKGGTAAFDFQSNMLARLFDLPALEDSEYAPVVWKFLNEVAPADPDRMTRRQRLIATWVKVKRIDAPDSPSGRAKIAQVTSEPGPRLSIDDLEDRAAMLADVRAKLSFLKRDLAAVLQSLPPLVPDR